MTGGGAAATGRRPLWTVVGLLTVAALLLWVGSLRSGGAGQSALAVLALAVIAASLATSGVLRRALGVLVVVVGVVAVPASLGAGAVPAALGSVAAVALATAGALLATRGHLLPRMGARYDRAEAGGETGPRGRREQDLWDELDAGRDPTS